MKKAMLSLLLLTIVDSAHSAKADMGFSANYQLGEQTFERCTTTNIKAMIFVNVGDAALYLDNCQQADMDEFLLAIRYERSFTAKEFRDSSEVLIQRNVTADQFQAIRQELERFNSAYQAVKPGDEYRISFTQDRGLELRKNDQQIIQSDNIELAQAYFKVWFGDKPFNKGMKNNLLKGIE